MDGFSWESIWGFIKKSIPSWTGSLADMVMSPIQGLLSFISQFGGDAGKSVTDLVNQAKDKVSSLATNLVGTTNPDYVLAKQTLLANLDNPNFLNPVAQRYGIPTDELKSICVDATNEFIKDGIPALGDQNMPTKAVKTAMDIRDALVKKLVGDGSETVGILITKYPQSTPAERDAMADAIASYVTGITAGQNFSSLCVNIPKGGLISMLANVQTKMNAKDFKENSLKASDIALVLDSKSLISPDDIAKAKGAANDNISAGAPADHSEKNSGVATTAPKPKTNGIS